MVGAGDSHCGEAGGAAAVTDDNRCSRSVPICFKQKAGWGEGTSVETVCNWKLPLYCKKSLERK